MDPSLSSKDFPGLYTAADEGSLSGQRSYLLLTRVRLGAAIAAAGLGVHRWSLAIHGRNLEVPAAGAIVAFGVALLVEVALLQLKPERRWYDGRALAESTKTLAWRSSVGGEPFSIKIDADTDSSDEALLSRLRDIQDGEPGRDALTPNALPAISAKMRWLRSQPLEVRRNAYLTARIIDQQGWYAKKASANRRQALLWRLALISVELSGLVWAILEVSGVLDVAIEGLVATIVAAGGAWLELRQHESLSRAYSVAAQELGSIRSELEREFTDEDSWARAVDSAEEAISREHTMWRASRAARS